MSGPRPILVYEVCPVPEIEAALGVLYHRVRTRDRVLLVAEGMAEIARGELDPAGLWVVWKRGKLVGAMLTQTLAGRAAAVWAPEVRLRLGRSRVAVDLVRHVLSDLTARGVQIAQALVDGSSPHQADLALTRGGLPRITDLIYLSRETAPDLPVDQDLPPFHWARFDDTSRADFAEALRQTYLGSLDMPELEGVRSLDDVLASHQAGGRFDPTRWRIGRLDGEPEAAAVLLLSELPERDVWEVAYLGLTPTARGRGLGRVALLHALDTARPHTSRLELAVDVRNTPATKLYGQAGFREFDRRAVHLAVLGPGSAKDD